MINAAILLATVLELVLALDVPDVIVTPLTLIELTEVLFEPLTVIVAVGPTEVNIVIGTVSVLANVYLVNTLVAEPIGVLHSV